MTLNHLIKTASKGYPDDLVEMIHAGNDGRDPPMVADGLASFVATEIKETFDEDASNKEQLDTAIGVVHKAIEDLEGVLNSLIGERFR